jgi:serine protease
MGVGWNSETAILTPGDVTGDGNADVLGRDTAGRLRLCPGNGAGRFLSRRQIGNGWKTMMAVTSAANLNGAGRPDLIARDVSGDAWADILARDTTGSLRLYRGSGTGRVGGRTLVSPGWAAMTALVNPGNWDRAAGNDLLARDAAGPCGFIRATTPAV